MLPHARPAKAERSRARLGVLVVLLLTASACTPALTPSGAPLAEISARPSSPQMLTIAVNNEPLSIQGFVGTNANRGSGLTLNLVHSTLTAQDEHGAYQPQLATQVISVDDGSWRLNSDGTMDVTWKLRPNVHWHDGTLFTSADLLFTFKVKKDPSYPTVDAAILNLMESAAAPDPLTFAVHWANPYYQADAAQGLIPLPEHLLADGYARGDTDAFVNSPFFTSEFVGLGPYKLTNWERGAEMDLTRFDSYFLGRPGFDSVAVRFISDPNSMIAAILAGAVDLVYPPGVDFDAALSVRDRWRGTDNAVRFEPPDPEGRMRVLEIQYRPEFARPRGGLSNPVVRQALYFTMDRATLIEVITHGLATVADSWVPPFSSHRAALESAIPQFPYDPLHAQQLLAQAGWKRGTDGVLISDQTGERFELTLRASQIGGAQFGKDKEITAIADNWKQVGVDPNLDLKTIGTTGDRGYEGATPGVADVGQMAPYSNFFQRMNSKYIASEANRWTGFNLAGYKDSASDSLLEQYLVTIDVNGRLEVERQLLQHLIGNVAAMPLYWEVSPLLISANLDPSLISPLYAYKLYQWKGSGLGTQPRA